MTQLPAAPPLRDLSVITLLAALLAVALVLALRLQLRRRAACAEISRLHALVDAVPDQALLLLDASGCVRHWNIAATLLHGYRAVEVMGQHYAVLFTPEQRHERTPENELESVAGGKSLTARVIRMHRDGRRLTLESRLSALRDDEGRLVGFSVVESDLGERLEGEQALAEARLQMAGVRKLAALGRLSEGIAHEFNNVVHVIRTSVALLQRQWSGNAQALELLRMIERNADRTAGLSQHLLMLAQRRALVPVATDVNAVVGAVVALLRQTLSESIVVEEQLDEPLCWVVLDRSELEAALLHVAANARDAMPSGGKLTFSTSEILPAAAEVQHAIPVGHSVAIRVEGSTAEASGLDVVGPDLAAVGDEDSLELLDGLLEHAHGQIQVQRRPQGSTVTLYLPCRPG